jgi:hypothetical protein
MWSVARIYNTSSPKIGFTQNLVCKNNHTKNKDLKATRPVACERYYGGLLYKIGFNPIGSLNLKIWIY